MKTRLDEKQGGYIDAVEGREETKKKYLCVATDLIFLVMIGDFQQRGTF